MGDRLSGAAPTPRLKMGAGHITIVVAFLAIGLLFIGSSIINGEGRLHVKDVESVVIHVRETEENILLSDAEVDAFKDIFEGKATYKMKEGEEPAFKGYVITVTAGAKTFYVSKDTVTFEEAGQGYTLRMLLDEWTDFKALLQSRNIAL